MDQTWAHSSLCHQAINSNAITVQNEKALVFDEETLYADRDNKVHGANMGPTWVLSAPDGPHVGPMNLAIRGAEILQCWDVYKTQIYVHITSTKFNSQGVDTDIAESRKVCCIRTVCMSWNVTHVCADVTLSACRADAVFNRLCFIDSGCILIQIPLSFVLKGPRGNMSPSTQLIAWHRIGYTRLSEPIVTQICDVMRHLWPTMRKNREYSVHGLHYISYNIRRRKCCFFCLFHLFFL